MKNPDKLWYDICYRYAEQSKCKSRHVGCVIVFEDRVIGQGYNGAPEGSKTDDCKREKCCNKDCTMYKTGSSLDKAICTHSEANAIGYCARHGVQTRGAYIYCTTFPCAYCAGLIVAAGLKAVIYDKCYVDDDAVKLIFKNANIKYRKFFTDLYE